MTTLTVIFFVCFPFTLAISRGEREQFSIGLPGFTDTRFADRLATILPLPGGEGRGEGECWII